MTQKTQCNDCLTIFTGIGDRECPECEGTMHEIEYRDDTKKSNLPSKGSHSIDANGYCNGGCC